MRPPHVKRRKKIRSKRGARQRQVGSEFADPRSLRAWLLT